MSALVSPRGFASPNLSARFNNAYKKRKREADDVLGPSFNDTEM